MIVRHLSDIDNTKYDVRDKNWRSQRLLLAKDGMGFSFHITTIDAGTSIELCYENHFESVYCMSGEGSIKDLKTGITHEIKPGTVYALNEHDRHILSAESTLELACVFNPACTGEEVHDKNGAYPAAVNTVVSA